MNNDITVHVCLFVPSTSDVVTGVVTVSVITPEGVRRIPAYQERLGPWVSPDTNVSRT